MNFQIDSWLFRVALVVGCVLPASAAAPDGVAFFESRIRPLLAEHCYECHSASAKKLKGGLRLDTRDGWAKGGDSGPALIAGKPDDSLLIKGIRHWDKDFKMPPDQRLKPSEIADLIEWVKLGAPDPRTNAAPVSIAGGTPAAKPLYGVSLAEGRKHWSFQPVKEIAPPAVKDRAWPRNELDFFTLARMEQAGVVPAPDANRRALIRRATFDLTGLPPTPEAVAAFLQDHSPDAFARVVDRLLASSAYGERWGRHWLDLVRYADTCGNASDYPVPQAYKYRNYVLSAFNRDLPYDQFIREQIAGDLLPAKSETEQLERTVATGYLAISRHFGGGGGERHLTIEDSIDNLGRTFLGLSINCARCHDHKFDPVSSQDYYALYGIFDSSRYPHPGSEGMNRPKDFVPLIAKAELEALQKAHKEKAAAIDAEIKQLETDKAAAAKELDAAEKKVRTDKATAGIADAKARQKALGDGPVFAQAYALVDATATNAHLQVRGDPKRLGEEVPRRFPQILGGQSLPKDSKTSGRLELGGWVADPANPLTARVLVNRLWQHHFGRGLVTTPNDFGARGTRPSHPELLDYLARRFVQGGWSMKSMHRLMLLSHTWQLASVGDGAGSPDAAPVASGDWLARGTQNDPNNLLWWHADRRRLDAEAIRDALLFVGGNLDTTPGGEHPFPAVNTWGFTQHNQFFAVYDNKQRTVYQMQQRLRKHPFLALFDGADPNSSTAVRDPSTTPLQSLFMMNDKFAHEQAALFAARVLRAETDDARRVERAFLTAYARPPLPEETRAAQNYLRQFSDKLAARKTPAAQIPTDAWASLSRALLGANEFLYVD